MIQNILVALDPDEDTPVAIDYACSIAHQRDASVTGIAVVDTRRIEKQSSGGGIGSMYYAEILKEKWTEQTRKTARQLIADFQDASQEAEVKSRYLIREGRPADCIVDEMRFQDVLVIGNVPHFFYVHPDEQTTTLTQIVKNGVGPVLIVPDKKVDISSVLIAYDGSYASARAMQRFCQSQPFGNDMPVEIINIYATGEQDHSDILLIKARDYVASWGFSVDTVSMGGTNHYDLIMQHADTIQANMIVAGAHSVSRMSQLAFGSTTASLVESGEKILFLER